jgi:hypothetical protein
MSNADRAISAPPVPTMTLAGEEWSVPILAPRQNRVVVPLIDAVLPKIDAARRKALVDPADDKSAIIPAKWVTGLIENGAYDDLCAICHAAITRARPDITREMFDDMPVASFELLAALPLIGRQAGMIVARKTT